MTELAENLLHDDHAPDNRDNGRWRLDRRIPLGVIAGLALFALAQAAGALWWVATRDARLDSRIEAVQNWTRETARLDHRLTVIETQLDILVDKRKAER